uniref:CNH domain-containing protein n=1 Tax=Oryza punctata TaxID=4537 RepID=A0A0E0KI90_ORYPU
MVHSAYDAVELVSGVPGDIVAVASYAGRLLVAGKDGSLRIYASPGHAGGGIPRDAPYALERQQPSLWRRGTPLAMEVSAGRELLLSLAECVNLHRLPGLETVAVIGKTKGANLFAWDDRRGLLAVGRWKRLTIFRLDSGREFVEVKEFGVPDTVKSMAWCGDNICLGIRKEYMIINSMTGALTEVFSSGRNAPPLVVALPTGELLLGKTVVLRDVQKLVETENCILAVLARSVYGLLPVPIGAQIVQLTASGEFEEALALCKLLPPEDSNLRAAKESSIHIRYGHFLFDNGSYEEAMEQFSDSHVDITYVLSLYPSLVLPQTHIIGEHDRLQDLPELARESSDVTDDMEPYSLQLHESDDTSPLEIKKMSHNALIALVKYLHKKRNGIIERATAEVTEEVVSGAVHHSSILSESYRSKKPNKKRAQTHTSSIAREMATVVDTSLLQALILTGQSSGAIELLKGLNYCDLNICKEFLEERNDYMVLLELYRSNEMHREALQLLNQLVEESKAEMGKNDFNKKFNPQMIIEYLRPLCRSDPMLVLESSLYVLERNPSDTIELFLSENVPADLVNSYLKQHAPNLQSTYLELMLSMSVSGINPNLQNELVQLYLSEVLDWHKILKEEGNWTEKTYSPTRKKLITTLENNSGYNTDILLKRLPQDALFEERAILYGKINQHLRALSLYVHKLQMPERAVAYCDRVYEEGAQQPSKSNIYFNLLQIYLNPRKAEKEFEQKIVPVASQYPGIQKATKVRGGRMGKKVVEIEGADDVRFNPSGTDSGRSDGDGDGDDVSDGGPIMLNEALELLSQRWDRINGAQALRLLPRDTKLQDLVLFLEPLLRNSSEHRRNYMVIKNLIFRANLQVKEDLYKRRQAVLKIDGDSMCSLCHKRIANSAFAIYPNGQTLVHFVCFRESQQIKAVRGVNSVKPSPQASKIWVLSLRTYPFALLDVQ